MNTVPSPSFRRRLAAVAVVLVVGSGVLLSVRAAFAEVYRVSTDRVAPEIPRGSRVVVSKTTRTPAPGDIIAYRVPDAVWLGRVVEIHAATDTITIEANDHDRTTIRRTDVVGRVILNTR